MSKMQSHIDAMLDIVASGSHTRQSPGFVFNPILDDNLSHELKFSLKALSHFLPEEAALVDPAVLYRAMTETLMSAGLIDFDEAGGKTVLKLNTNFERDGLMLVPFLLALEVVLQGLRRGLDVNECMDHAMEPRNWRAMEPLPRHLVALVRKAQRQFPVKLVSRLSLELFWTLAEPFLVREGLIEKVSVS